MSFRRTGSLVAIGLFFTGIFTGKRDGVPVAVSVTVGCQKKARTTTGNAYGFFLTNRHAVATFAQKFLVVLWNIDEDERTKERDVSGGEPGRRVRPTA